jgi:hypothetical protein
MAWQRTIYALGHGARIITLLTLAPGIALGEVRLHWQDTQPGIEWWAVQLDGTPAATVPPAQVTPLPTALQYSAVRPVETRAGQLVTMQACVGALCSDVSNAVTVPPKNTPTATPTPSASATATQTGCRLSCQRTRPARRRVTRRLRPAR